jgi:hypothetical protein
LTCTKPDIHTLFFAVAQKVPFCNHDTTKQYIIVIRHICRRGGLVLLTKATAEESALSSRRTRGKESMEGSLSLVPCPFQDTSLVPLHSAVQQDVLQVC